MEVICLEEKAFYELIQTVLEKVQPNQEKSESRWINKEAAMNLLGVKSKTTLQKLRDDGLIRFSQPQSKIIMYDRLSIEAYLDKHAKNPF